MRYANDLRTGPLTAPAAPVWPLFAGLGPLGALPTAGRLARAFTALVLTSWRLGDLAEDCETVTGELVANVVQAATGPDGQPWYDEQGRLPVLWLRLLSDGAALRVEVWDTLPGALDPVPRSAGSDEESGRGLTLIGAFSRDWGCDQLPGRDAKRVWALLSRA
jgi:anti-sigma regulatory factor (Ser/Thr protein kinase)